MKDVFDLLVQVITVDIFIGFGLYSILYVLVMTFKKDLKLLQTLDTNSTRFVVFVGIIYFAINLIWTINLFAEPGVYKVRGQYWWVPWLQPLIWTMITQLFWINKIKELKVIRIIIAILLIVSFERYVIIVTSFHRDYIPWNWMMFSWITPTEIIIGLTTKIILFCALATLYSYVLGKLKLILNY
jgi:hypothetical protein